MSLLSIGPGLAAPEECNVIIEIPMNAPPVKYEVNKNSGALFVDRFLSTSMFYPLNYGYIPQTLSEDGDPVDVLVMTPVPVQYGTVISVRMLGLLKMTDESGVDAKLLAVPMPKICALYNNINSYLDLPPALLDVIEHFFSHYKDLEKGKWVKVDGWADADAAKNEVKLGIERYKPH
jgi:inorganic pyrophosphatase